MKVLSRFLTFGLLLALAGCINPPNPPTNCIDKDNFQSIVLIRGSDNSLLVQGDQIVLPMREGETESLLVRVELDDAPENPKPACMVVRDKDFFTNPVIAKSFIPLGRGDVSSQPWEVVKFTCRDQKVYAGGGDTFRNTGEKQTRIFVQAVSDLGQIPNTGQGGAQSERVIIRCPDVTIRD